MNTEKECIYTKIEDYEDTWECSNCREWWSLIDGTPEENNMKYCPFCGAKIIKSKTETLDELIDKME